MYIIPAIDLKDGHMVQRKRGEAASDLTAYLEEFKSAGAAWVQVTDLDGARQGLRANFPLVDQIVRSSGMKVQLCGAIHSEPDLITTVGCGAHRAVIPTAAAMLAPGLVPYALMWCPEQTAVAVESLNGRVWTGQQEDTTGVDCIEFARSMAEEGIKCFVFTDMAAQLTGAAMAFDTVSALRTALPDCEIIVSGGVNTLNSVHRLRDLGVWGAVVDRGYYSGTLDLAQAVQAAEM